MFGMLLEGGGLLGTVLVGLPAGMQGFATVADVPAGCVAVAVVDDMPVADEVFGLVEDEVPVDDGAPVDDGVPVSLVPMVEVVVPVAHGPVTVDVVWPCVPPVTLPALPATPGIPAVALGEPVEVVPG